LRFDPAEDRAEFAVQGGVDFARGPGRNAEA